MEHFGARVIALRTARGWTRRHLAQRALLHEQHLSKVEKGERTRIEADTLIKLAQALQVSTDYLLGLTPTPSSLAPAPREMPARA